MRLDYMAHSCFLLESCGYRVLFDPYDPAIGYPSPNLYSVDLVVVSHDHEDHNCVSQVSGPCMVARGVARRQFGPLTLDGRVAFHGEDCAAEPVSLTLLEWSGRRLAHFGDLGCELDDEQVCFFQDLDLLMIPCGGGYTIGPEQAWRAVSRLRPKLVVPMHYRTPFLNRERFPNFQTQEAFVSACQDWAQVETCRQGWVQLEELWQKVESSGKPILLDLRHQMA